MMIELQHHFLPFQLLSSSSSSVTVMEFRKSALDEPPPPPPPHPPLPPQLWLQRSSSELPGMEFQSPAPPPTPPLLWLQRHPPPLPGCNVDSETTNVNPENQRNADKVKEGSKLIWRRKKSPSSSAESSTDISKTKREALSPAIGEKVWRCSICQVRTTSEAELKNHFQGKKHRSMEAVLKPEGNGSTLGLGAPHEPRVEEQINRSETLLQTLSPIISTKCSDENHAPMLSEKKIESKRKEKEDFAFWCEMCKVGADHESVLESHMNGKKHLSQLLQKQTANVGEVPIQEEVKLETVTKIHSEVSQPSFSKPPALNQRVFVQGTGVAPISGFGIGCNVEYFGKGTGMANGNVDPDIQRAFEKQKIREEIIAGEIARRRELEAEVREELRIERELEALRMKRGNVFDGVRVSMEPWGKSPMQEVEGLSLGDNIVRPVEESLRIQGRTQTSRMEDSVKPIQQMSIESKVDETGQEKGKNNFLKEASNPAKGSSAYSVFGVWGVRNMEGKKEWRCFICRVSATSETDLKQHFNGNKHRSKRAALKAEKRAAATTELQAEEKAVHLSRTEPLLPTPPPLVSAKPSFDGKSESMLPEISQAEKSAAITVEAIEISQIEPTPPPIATAKPLDGHGTSVSTLPEKKKKAMVIETFKLQEKPVQTSGIEPLMPTPPPTATAKPLDGHGNSTSILPGNENKEKGEEKLAFWSEMGTGGANNKYLMKRASVLPENKNKEKGAMCILM